MGVETGDCRKVAELIGVKTFTYEFIAYGNLKVLIENRQALSNYTTFHNTTDWFWDKGNVVLNITGEFSGRIYLGEIRDHIHVRPVRFRQLWLHFVGFRELGAKSTE
ncbi:uncharacterized protein LOC128226450 [Mya arenaria]|uniref:uncharacterized protein LOC128226450 n=1 Tax=Mya arenaria TaxID=6604 RepID=UPI0022E2AEB1|nr:uncharacterized protein LOC128226450 [Mya arenaria]